MKYVVTGGAGFIGSNIVKKLVSRGDNVTVIDNLNTGKEENLTSVKDKINFFNDSVLNMELLEKETQNIDGVFHQAALASVQDSFSKPDEYHDVNVNGTENILKLAKKNKFKVVYASSSSVYGNPERIPIKEIDSKNPINPYAETKLKKEEIFTDGCESSWIEVFQCIWKRAIKRICRSFKIISRKNKRWCSAKN